MKKTSIAKKRRCKHVAAKQRLTQQWRSYWRTHNNRETMGRVLSLWPISRLYVVDRNETARATHSRRELTSSSQISRLVEEEAPFQNTEKS
jgi:hypothetical protein